MDQAQSTNELIADLPAGQGPVLLPELFEAQVRRTPDRVAVVRGTTSWTYRELNARADTLAGTLITMGVGPEQVVAVILPPS